MRYLMLIFLLSGCAATEVIGGDEFSVQIRTSIHSNPIQVAQIHCNKFGKQPVYAGKEGLTGQTTIYRYRCA